MQLYDDKLRELEIIIGKHAYPLMEILYNGTDETYYAFRKELAVKILKCVGIYKD